MPPKCGSTHYYQANLTSSVCDVSLLEVRHCPIIDAAIHHPGLLEGGPVRERVEDRLRTEGWAVRGAGVTETLTPES